MLTEFVVGSTITDMIDRQATMAPTTRHGPPFVVCFFWATGDAPPCLHSGNARAGPMYLLKYRGIVTNIVVIINTKNDLWKRRGATHGIRKNAT